MSYYKSGDIITIDRDAFIAARLADDLLIDLSWYDLPDVFTAKADDEEFLCSDGLMWIDIDINDGAGLWMCPLSAIKQTFDKTGISRLLVKMYQEG